MNRSAIIKRIWQQLLWEHLPQIGEDGVVDLTNGAIQDPTDRQQADFEAAMERVAELIWNKVR